MAIAGNIYYRDLNVELELHKVVVSPASDTSETVAARVIAYPNLTYWTASSIGIVIHLPDDMEAGDWTEWYFLWGGINYYFFQFWIIDDEHSTRQFVFVEGRSPHFSDTQIALGDLETFASDVAAAAAGLAVGDYYRAALTHDRADSYSITSRIE